MENSDQTPVPGTKVYVADGFHGGVAVLLCAVDRIISLLLAKVDVDPTYKVVLELDGYTFEDWRRNPGPVLDELKQAIGDGRVELVNGAYTQPFAENIGLESNIRQLLWGKRLAKEVLGVDLETYLIQEHAFHTALPQILNQLGYRQLVLRTHWPMWGIHRSYPLQSFYWEGCDGSKILTVPLYEFVRYGRVPDDPPTYDSFIQRRGAPGVWGWEAVDEENIQRWLQGALQEGIARPLASRDEDLIASCLMSDEEIELIARDDRLQFVTAAEHAELVRAETDTTLDLHPDEMDTILPFGLMGDVIPIGCKRVENLLLTAEKLAAAAYLIAGRLVCDPNSMNGGGGQHYQDDLNYAWRKLMLAQQHDVWVCGPSATMGYSLADRGLRWLRQAEEIADEIVAESLTQILGGIDWQNQSKPGLPVLIANPLSWTRAGVVSAGFEFERGAIFELQIWDDGGAPVPSQLVEAERWADGSLRKVSVLVDAGPVPGIGYKVLYAGETEGADLKTDLRISGDGFSNRFVDVRLSEKGITGITYRPAGEREAIELVPEGGVAGYLTAFCGDKGYRIDTRDCESSLELVEQGPVRARYRITGRTPAFGFTKEISLTSNQPVIEIKDEVDFPERTYLGHLTPPPEGQPARGYYAGGGWHVDCFVERDKLRAVFPVNVQNGTVRRNVVYVPSATKREDFSAYDWSDVSDSQKGLALVNTGNQRYCYDRESRELSLVLGFSGNFLYTSDDFHFMQGRYVFRYALLPHAEFDPMWDNRWAAEVLTPLISRYNAAWSIKSPGAKQGDLPSVGSLLTLKAESSAISTVTLEGGDLIVRVFESTGCTDRVTLTCFRPIEQAREERFSGQVVSEIEVRHDSMVELELQPFQIRTLRLKPRL